MTDYNNHAANDSLEMRKVLFIAYLYPPIANSGTRRSLEFVNHLPDSGWEPIVLTAAPSPADCEPSLLEEVRAGTHIERVPLWIDQFSDNIGQIVGRRIADGLKWRLQRLFQVPDECASWRSVAVRKGLELFRQEGFDAIYASGWPWTSFLVAEELSRKCKRPFIVDYRDLWKPSDAEWDKHTILQKWLQPKLEKRVLRNASAVVSTTSTFARMLEDSGANGKAFCITNGFDPDDFCGTGSLDQQKPDNTFQISYTGVWRPGYGPEDLYRAISQLHAQGAECLHNLKFVMAGFKPGRAKEFGIADIVKELGPIPHGEAIKIMMQSDALYLPVSGGFYDRASLPGKLFEYIGSGRSILSSAHADSEVASVLGTVGGAYVTPPGEIEMLADAICRMGNTGCTGVFSPRIVAEAARYERRHQSTELARILESVVAESQIGA